MLKKLQSLLFEDEEDDEIIEDIEEEEEEEEEEIVEVKPAPRRRGRRAPQPEPEPEPEPIPQPQYTAPAEPAKPVMTRVEVTKTIPVQKAPEASVRPSSVFNSGDSVFRKPSQPSHASRPVFEPAPSAPAPDPVPVSSFGISADQQRPANNIRPAAEAARPQRPQQQERPAASRRPAQTASVYEFRPVISPMFGVDEKDMQSVQYAPKPNPAPAVHPVHESSKVISPIYGAAEQDVKPAAGSRPNDYSSKENPFYSKNQQPEEDKGFPEFSLDDILSARDEEFSRQNYFSNPDPIRSADIDETVVIDTNRFSPFDQQTLDFDRKK